MRWLVVSLAVLGAGCDAGARHFRDVPVTRVAVGEAVFDVRVRGELAEAVRRNVQYAPRLGPLRGQAGLAMHQVSGCEVVYVLGDQAVTLGLLDCDGKPRDWHLLLQNRGYECNELGGLSRNGPGGGYTTFECDPY